MSGRCAELFDFTFSPTELLGINAKLDADGDSQMRSSSDEDESEALFPSDSIPQKQNPTSSTFTSELSPPASQDAPEESGFQDEEMDLTGSHDAATLNKWGGGPKNALNTTVRKDEDETKGEEQEPGYAWNNQKAKDDFHRAWDQVTDKNFSLRENHHALPSFFRKQLIQHLQGNSVTF